MGKKVKGAGASEVVPKRALAPPWSWRCVKDSRGIDLIDAWVRENLSPRVQGALERTLDHLRQQPLSRWSRPYGSPVGDHIYVIRFVGERRFQWRITGHADEEHGAFVMTTPGYEKDNDYYPSDYKERAGKAKQHVSKDFDKYTARCFPHPSDDG